MRNFVPQYFSIELKVLVLVILIHIIIAKLFHFTIASNAVSDKPVFVFWGSFLDPIESGLIHDNSYPDLEMQHTPIIEKKIIAVKMPAQKPAPEYQADNQDHKNFVKKTFLDESPLQEKDSIDSEAHVFYTDTKAKLKPLIDSQLIP